MESTYLVDNEWSTRTLFNIAPRRLETNGEVKYKQGESVIDTGRVKEYRLLRENTDVGSINIDNFEHRRTLGLFFRDFDTRFIAGYETSHAQILELNQTPNSNISNVGAFGNSSVVFLETITKLIERLAAIVLVLDIISVTQQLNLLEQNNWLSTSYLLKI